MATRETLRKEQYIYHCSQLDESDDESFHVRFAAVEDFPIEELLLNEYDVAKYYKGLCSFANNRKDSAPVRKSYKSTAIQTEPDPSGIPPSWILTGQKLVSELYEGLGNIINTVYHSPSDLSEENIKGTGAKEPKSMKYFTREKGYWTSKLIPDVKIFASGEIDRQRQILYSKDFKKKLENLLGIASKLRNLIPYVDARFELPKYTTNNEVQPSVENKSQQTDETKTQCENQGLVMTPPNEIESCTDFSDTLTDNSAISIDVPGPEHPSKLPDDIKNLVGEISIDNQEPIPVIKTSGDKEAKWKSAQTPGIIVSRYKLEPQSQLRVQMTGTRKDVKVPKIDAKMPDVKRNFITFREKSIQIDKQVPNFKTSIKSRVEAEKSNSSNCNKVGIEKVNYGLDRNIPTKEKESICISSTNQPKPQKQLKAATSINKSSKDFIQKNILAAKLKLNLAGPSNLKSKLNSAGPSKDIFRVV